MHTGECEVVGRMRGGAPDVLAVHARELDRLAVAWVLADGPLEPELVQALCRLEHPLIARTVGLTTVDGQPALLSEPLPPRTLKEHLDEQGLLPEPAALQLGLRLCEALAVIHEAGLVHGAVSPESVHVDGPEVVLADFRRARPGGDPRVDLAGLAAVLSAAVGEPSPPLAELCARCRGEGDAFATARAVSGALLALADALVPGDTWPSMPPQLRTTPVPLLGEREGEAVGSYVLQKLLGEGSMGRVFAARHLRLGRHVALKVLRPEHAASTQIVQRFFQEARTVNEIDHEHIVQIFDFVEEVLPDGRPRAYCVMELLEGQSLADLARREPLPLERIVPIAVQLCQALAAAHRVGVVHRDVKPDNVFVTEREGRDFVKVVDFGIAKLERPMGDLAVGTTLHGAIIGTPSYMSPEQAAGLEVDHRADLHAVGVVLYELLSGSVPYTATRFGALAAQIIGQPHPPLPALTAAGEPLPRGLRELVEQLLAKDPRARPSSAEAVERVLLQALAPESRLRRNGRKALVVAGAAALATGVLVLLTARPHPAPEVAATTPARAELIARPPAPLAQALAPPPLQLTVTPELAADPPPALPAVLPEARPPEAAREDAPRHARRSRPRIIDPFAQ